MRVLILWADDRSANLGVRALAAGTEDLVRRVFPGAEISLVNFGSGTAPVPLHWKGLAKAGLTRRRALRDWIANFDLAVDTRAGDSFADIYGLERLAAMSLLAELCAEAGLPVVMGPQTIGPFGTRRGRAVARFSMRRAAAVIARDPVSAQAARVLGRPADATATDVVFAIASPRAGRPRDVVLNVSGLLWGPNRHVDHGSYQRTVTAVARRLLADGRRLSLLAHVIDSPNADNDVPAIRALAARLDQPDVELVVPESLGEVREVLSSARLVIGSRMHACLNALSAGTPAVPLAYSRKFDPLLADLDWPHTVDLRTARSPVEQAADLSAADLTSDVARANERAQELLARAERVLERAR